MTIKPHQKQNPKRDKQIVELRAKEKKSFKQIGGLCRPKISGERARQIYYREVARKQVVEKN